MDTSELFNNLIIPHSGLVESVILVEWLVTDGKMVNFGDPCLVYESEKTQVQIDAPCDGVVEIMINASDEEILVGTLVGRIRISE